MIFFEHSLPLTIACVKVSNPRDLNISSRYVPHRSSEIMRIDGRNVMLHLYHRPQYIQQCNTINMSYQRTQGVHNIVARVLIYRFRRTHQLQLLQSCNKTSLSKTISCTSCTSSQSIFLAERGYFCHEHHTFGVFAIRALRDTNIPNME